jgi:hypothetical protein
MNRIPNVRILMLHNIPFSLLFFYLAFYIVCLFVEKLSGIQRKIDQQYVLQENTLSTENVERFHCICKLMFTL